MEEYIRDRLIKKLSLFFIMLVILVPLTTKAFNHRAKELVVGKSPDVNVNLYATERKGHLEKFRLDVNGAVQYFPFWKNVSNEAYSPQLIYNDINQNGEKELIIILTTSYGSRIIHQNVHVLHKTKTNIGDVYREVSVDNPMSTLLKTVETDITKSEAIITIGNKKNVIKIDKLDIAPKNLFPDIVTGNLIRFKVLDNELTAILGAQITPVGGYIGSFHISYELKQNRYQVKKVEFYPIELS
ncbi:hypothetical protein ACQKMD_11465 [Viridibacillus sp. NPDC096237]|uniref:hypothetical protein n=1 Tax=Viridibacillus sp. NPDC096237 TaxID=3390721 RepID=UPI003CFD22FB